MTNEQLLQLRDAISANLAGKPVQYRIRETPHTQWIEWQETINPSWDVLRVEFRAKPIIRPWSKPSDVPGPVCWIRANAGQFRLLVSADFEGIYVAMVAERGSFDLFQWNKLQEFRYSTTRRADDWHPCTVEDQP